MPWDAAAKSPSSASRARSSSTSWKCFASTGVTRLSLGVENFEPEILQFNGRAHLEEEIYRAYGWARDLGFPQINIDLIAGMVGEDWDNWRDCVRKTIALAPECVTIYQMELPYNTVFSQGTEGDRQRRADAGRRRLADEAGLGEVRLRRAREGRLRGLERDDRGEGQGEDAVRLPRSLWHGADMFGTGVASFGHVDGVHVQNVDTWEQYIEKLDAGELPLGRAFPTTERDRLIREMMLLLKTGHLDVPLLPRQVRRGHPRRVPRRVRQARSAKAG